MTDQTTPPPRDPSSAGDEWPSSDDWGTAEETSRSDTGREWLGQLQEMIDNLATNAAPVVREVGAKAAELAALAGEKAGPIAHRAAEVTESAGKSLAERGRVVAADLRREAAARREAMGEPGAGAGPAPEATSDPGTEPPGRRPDAADSLGE